MKAKTAELGAILTLLLIQTSCINPIKGAASARAYDKGEAAELRGDLGTARELFYKAYVSAQGRLGPEHEALPLYEWARVSGYLGKRADVEWAFPKVLDLIARAKGRADRLLAPALSEYARYLHDTGQHTKAVSIFSQAMSALEKRAIEKEDPVGFAQFLEEYATSLKQAGKSQETESLLKRAAALRDNHRGVEPKYKPRRYSFQQNTSIA